MFTAKTKSISLYPIHLHEIPNGRMLVPCVSWHLAVQMLQRLQNGSDECIFSYPKLMGRNSEFAKPINQTFSASSFSKRPLLVHVELPPRHVERSETFSRGSGGPHFVRDDERGVRGDERGFRGDGRGARDDDTGLVVMEGNLFIPLTPTETISGGTGY